MPYKTLKAKFIIFNFPEFDTKEKFLKIYNNNSIPDFKIKYDNLDPRLLCFYYGIKPRTISESKCCQFVQNKYEQTCLKKFGKPNALCKGTTAFKKKNKTIKKHWKVNNPFQAPEIIKKINDDKYWLNKYNCTRKEFLSEIGKKRWKNWSSKERIDFLNRTWGSGKYNKINGIYSSKYEDAVYNYLNELNFNINRQFCLCTDKFTFFYDFLITNDKLIIEVNGDYWHANPEIYKQDDILHFPDNVYKTANDIWEKDKIKKELANSNGYKLIYIWEKELIKIKNSYDFKKLLNEKLL